MAERSYFSLRYIFPGFSFIFIIFILNLDILSEVVIGEKQVLIPIISFLGGSPFGFLIYQVYWAIFLKFVMPFFMLNIRHAIRSNYHTITRNRAHLINVWNYIVHTLSEKDRRLYEYIARRYDMTNVLWSETFSINFALSIGLIIRYHLFPYALQIRSKTYFLHAHKLWILPYIVWIYFIFLVISIVCIFTHFYTKRQYEDMAEVIIRRYRAENDYTRLLNVFPFYFNAITNHIGFPENWIESREGYYSIVIIICMILFVPHACFLFTLFYH